LSFGEKQRGIVDSEIHAVTIAKLRIIGARACSVAVEYGLHKGKIVADIGPEASPHGCKWR
jgi:hypothetical protein